MNQIPKGNVRIKMLCKNTWCGFLLNGEVIHINIKEQIFIFTWFFRTPMNNFCDEIVDLRMINSDVDSRKICIATLTDAPDYDRDLCKNSQI